MSPRKESLLLDRQRTILRKVKITEVPAITAVCILAAKLNHYIHDTIEDWIGGIGDAREISDLVYPVTPAHIETGLPVIDIIIEELQKMINSVAQFRCNERIFSPSLDNNEWMVGERVGSPPKLPQMYDAKIGRVHK